MSAGRFLGRRALLVAAALIVVAAIVAAVRSSAGDRSSAAPVAESVPPGEPPAEMIGLGSQLQARSAAPFSEVAPGALEAALAQKDKLAQKEGRWTPVGQTPMRSDDPTYSISRLGHGTLSGRATSFADDPARPGHHYVSASGGGVWETVDDGATWTSIGDGLPLQTVGGIGYSPASQTLIAGTGDNAFAGTAFSGLGIYRSVTDGKKWKKSQGVPDNILTFAIAFDPADPSGKTVYAATS